MHAAPLLLVIVAVAVAGCPTLDVGRPIALVPGDSWVEYDVASLRNAAECWNLQFGTQVEVGRSSTVEQQVGYSFSDFVCLYAGARTEPTLPLHVFICPPAYAFADSTFREEIYFMILIHELGHVLNIRYHASDWISVMSQSAPLPYRFSAEDRRLFGDANPDFASHTTCRSVEIDRYTLPHRCSCAR
jgi:hypothetical protein